ncbi:hypothetical protein ACFQ73_02125 [Amycolatopsis japonica]|uniref:hypothetical protein n=1 Tax=Amycolatopsis japonica TaxID=208439 RepID=UPI00366B5259
MYTTWLSAASVVIALGSLLYSRRNTRTGKQSLDVASVVGQVNYENARANYTPAATLTLTEVEFRPPTALAGGLLQSEAELWATTYEPESAEIVARGRLVNNTDNELLLTLRDHPNSRRTTWYSYRNQSVFLLNGVEAQPGRAILPAGGEVTFEWIDRRSSAEWVTIYNLGTRYRSWTSSPVPPRPAWRRYVRALITLDIAAFTSRAIARSGFYVVCDSRADERVATIWHAEVVATPVTLAGRNFDTNELEYETNPRTVAGPIDDDTIRYRVTYDSTLALLKTPKKRYLHGRF